MDSEVLERLTRIEAKQDRIIAFINRAEGLLAAYLTGGMKGLLRGLLPGIPRSKVPVVTDDIGAGALHVLQGRD